MTTQTLKIDGMSCGHCIKAVTMALQEVPGVDVKDVTVGQARIEADEAVVTPAQLTAAIEEAGFALVSAAG
ncbi:heavy-metal-associated domain-containing protein [Luteitalea sp.]